MVGVNKEKRSQTAQELLVESNSMDDASVEPTVMSLDLLREITNGFSEERELGRGSFGKVYLGVHQDGKKLAVKKLYDMPGLDDKQFLNEFKNLTRLRHQNIVRLVGYCRDIQEVHVMYEGKLVLAERAHRALCLEYMSNGSLEKYISDDCDRYNWQTCYRIIKGICQGLKYLHNELKPPMYHLDLKPANVLLDENMVPRIADFGISRLFSDEQTRCTQSLLGTLGYSPPEFIRSNLISNKFDIFSLGVVVIKMMAGRAGYSKSTEMSSQEFTNLVRENWTNKLLETSSRRNAYSEQVKMCIEIGLSCVQEDRHKRPTIQDIMYSLEETETKCTHAARKDWLLIFQKENMNTFPHYARDLNDRHAEQIYGGSTSNQDIVATTYSNYFEENSDPGEARFIDYLQFGDPLPGIKKFQIVGDHRLGSILRAQGSPTNGTTLCTFQWIRWLIDGEMQYIEGATTHDYVVTADDVGGLLAVECTPMDNNGRQGVLVMEFANNKNMIPCDPDMQNGIYTCFSRGAADFDVFLLGQWKKAKLVVTRAGYRVSFSNMHEAGPKNFSMPGQNLSLKANDANFWSICHKNIQRGWPEVWSLVRARELNPQPRKTVIYESYSRTLEVKIPNGRTTQFVLVCAGGVNLKFNTRVVRECNDEDNYFRLRDLIVLVMRTFKKEACVELPHEENLAHLLMLMGRVNR